MSKIFRITEDKRRYMHLLLLGDEQEEMIERYLDRGELFAYADSKKVCAVCVLTDESNSICELKNISVLPEYQRKGIGRQLVEFVKDYCQGKYQKLIVGTGESPLTVPFYEKCGFVYTHRIKNFFTDNYNHPIYEGGVLLKDMVYFEIKFTED